MLLDTILRARDMGAHYTDAGVLPRDLLIAGGDTTFSLLMTDGGWLITGLFFLLNVVAAACLAVGVRTRLSTFVCWLLVISIQGRNPMLNSGGDVLLRLLLFWGFFLPWGRVWSLDGKAEPYHGPESFQSVAGWAYLLQLVQVYLFAALLKTGDAWRDGTAIYYALNVEHFSTPVGRWALQFPEYLEPLTFTVYYYELLVGLLFILPFFHGFFRTLGVFSLVFFHIAIALHMNIGMFSPIAMIASVGLLPTWFWDKLSRFSIFESLRPAEGQTRENAPQPRLLELLAGSFLILTIIWNFNSLPRFERPLPKVVNGFILSVRLDQKWEMFAPYPMHSDSKVRVEATLLNGKAVELLSSDRQDNQRWEKYYIAVCKTADDARRIRLLAYLTERWNRTHRGDWQLSESVLFVDEEMTPPPGGDPIRRTMRRAEFKR